ncbi:HpcH/HpaI aldolase/citrate lyase family protein [Salinarimonas ramus]|uniref:Citryl-CoA lyase n=1 Tax=Salinarimonas ramus TaxID=690164 RepID=A0A917Q6T0_9HYPH|nr:CoA ester lyase [Salinarimonas ramus]GGK24095.1 citryl-CoA lyase [Salinarimonas ramus]
MRSYLFVPGDSEKKLERALSAGADALIVDLEDSVAPGEKARGREVAAAFLARAAEQEGGPRLYVRVNALDTDLIGADLDAVMPAGPAGIVLPKASGGQDVAHLAAMVAVREAEYALPDGATAILAIATETARGVFALGTYGGSSHRLRGLAWGGEDLSADIGAEANRDAAGAYTEPYRLVRALALMGAAAAEVDAIDAVHTTFRDLDALAAECREARRDGFVAKLAIHPAQVPVINEAFTPSSDEIARARAIVSAFEANPGAGVVAIDGEMIDMPHLKRARRVLARAG